ncbi:MAG: DUF503 domain-containing protein [Thermodesulfobacteriota bacterium]|nr:DUF503 domain-containing protein [Thermodesulfobacteriota bacterium]
MIIGVLTLTFRLHGNHSLKGKRQTANSLKQKLRNKFNVAVSEIEAMDDPKRLVLALATVANETRKVESRLSKALALAEAATAEEMIDSRMEIFSVHPET